MIDRRVVGFMLLVLVIYTCPAFGDMIDEHTLFYASFDEGLDADYSQGNGKAYGGAVLVEGRSGNGVYLGRDMGTLRSEDGAMIQFTGVNYEVEGNLIPEEGTLEFWIKTPILLPDLQGAQSNYLYILDSRAKGSTSGFIMYYRYDAQGISSIHYSDILSNQEISLRANVSSWGKGEWHHIAVMWKDEMRWLYIDGKKMAQSEEFSVLPSTTKYILFGLTIFQTRPAEVIIDDLRISDVVRYQ